MKTSSSLHSPVLAEFPSAINIGAHAVGPGRPCYIIGEAGSNHDRSLEKALALVDAAADAGCDAVKFQSFIGQDIAAGPATADTRLPAAFSRWGAELQEFYAACALPVEFHKPLAERARSRNIDFLSSPFGEWAVDLLVELRVPALKLASFELVHLPLIRHAASSGLPLILSTGMAGLGDIERALDAAASGGAGQVALLHCGSSYPLAPSGVQLAAMETMRRAFNVPVGYSDHTVGISVPTAAVALGADIIEKHFTVAEGGDGPDHGFALRPETLKQMVTSIREAEAAVGLPRKRRQREEEEHVRRGRRSMVWARALPQGARISAADIKIVRPGTGLEPYLMDIVIGRRIVRPVQTDHPLSWDDLMVPLES